MGQNRSAVDRLSNTHADVQPAGVLPLEAATKRRIVETFARLEQSGVLSAAGTWKVQREPTDMICARLTLRNDADRHIMDGYAHVALVPAGVRGQEITDPNLATVFYLQRIGGIAGLTFMAGPFDLPKASGGGNSCPPHPHPPR